MIVLKNPETGQKHEMDGEAKVELLKAYDAARDADKTELVFRAMIIDMDTAWCVLREDE